MPPKILVSAGEASGDLYASELIRALRGRYPDAEFFGCTGPRMRAQGVRTVVDSASLAVVGLVEVIAHIPRIYGEFRKLVSSARAERPSLAILTDSPDFHLRLAAKLHDQGVPVVYLIAPQVWAWRKGRIPRMRRVLERLLCIFPFEPEFFAEHGMRADYIGHPLTRLVRPSLSKQEFFEKHGLPFDRPLVVLLPGSRLGEVGRHLPVLGKTAAELRARSEVSLILALPHGFQNRAGEAFFKERIGPETIQIVEGETWDALAHADVALAASGTVTIEAALLGTPTVSFYRVTTASWWMGRLLVRVPYYTMVNLVARRRIIPEYLQDEMTPAKLSEATLELLQNPVKADNMRRELNALRGILATERDPMETAAEIVARYIESV
ncbi:MAG TPA: lipid-A-disaccharide synthase [Bryobacteraceae bacterium]|nr:lipid-A-disaccharide synthase [Bryobacteraceae bacterium]